MNRKGPSAKKCYVSARQRRVLLIGPLPIEGDVIGGTKVSFAAMVATLSADDAFAVTVHDTSRPRRGRGRIARAWLDVTGLARLVARLANPLARYDEVLFNTSSGGALKSGPLVRAVCALRRWPLTVRVFGGDLDLFYERAGACTRWLAARTTLRARRILLQTGALCARFAPLAHVEWWPTTRDLQRIERATPVNGDGARRLLFLAQLRREKGVAEAVAAARGLPDGVTLTVHGPAMPGFDITSLEASPTWCYAGAVRSEDVPRVLAEHDALVFPTTHDGEGMPGIVIEAMQAGLPVIATDFRALAELIEDGENGLLVPPHDMAALRAAMQRLVNEPGLLARLRAGALRTGEEFRSEHWAAKLRGWLSPA